MTTQSSISEIFERNNLLVTERNQRLFISRKPKINKAITTDILFSILGIILGIILGLVGVPRIGGFVLIPAFVYLVISLNLAARKKKENKTTLEIINGYVEIKNGIKRTRIPFDDISEFSNRIFDAGNLRVGKISIITEKGKIVEILEVFGQDRDEDLIQEDLVQISNYIVDNYINDGI